MPSARVGGPHITAPAGENAARFLTAFLTHCDSGRNYATGEVGTTLDFIAFHAKGSPRFVDNMVRMEFQLRRLKLFNI